MKTIEYLREVYGYWNPIFLKDVRIGGKSKESIRKDLSRAAENGEIVRKAPGIYCFKDKEDIVDSVSFEKIVTSKYIKNDYGFPGLDLDIYGYFTGQTLLNYLGLTTQVPAVLEIATNNTSCKREIKIKGRRAILYKPKTRINRYNYKTLQFFDALQYLTINEIKENKNKLKKYIKSNLSKTDFETYISLYPKKLLKVIVDEGLTNYSNSKAPV